MTAQEVHGPDLTAGVPSADLHDGKPLLGHVGGNEVLLVRRSGHFYAVSAHCTHVGAPLSSGLIVGESLRCPWHHACFSLRDGAAECAPALSPLAVYDTHEEGGKIRVGGKRAPAPVPKPTTSPKSITIVGGGAAGHAAAEMLRTRGYAGPIQLFSADSAAPYDRTSLSKFYLAGKMSLDDLALAKPEHYEKQHINLRLGARVSTLNTRQRQLTLASGQSFPFDSLLLALGAEPIRLSIPGASLPHVHTLRSQAQAAALLEMAKKSHSVVIIGGSFIGMEAASALRAHKIPVHVVMSQSVPLQKVLGKELGKYMAGIHEKNGVVLHANKQVTQIEANRVLLADGIALQADLVLLGVGVRPNIDVAKTAGLAVDGGIVVDAHLQTNVEQVFSAGDNTIWPDRHSGQKLRVEHWAVAQRMGQTAARNMLGEQVTFDQVPFFWTMQHGTSIRYVGHTDSADSVSVHGSFAANKVAVAYHIENRVAAVATVGCDVVSLRCEAAMQQDDSAGLEAALGSV